MIDFGSAADKFDSFIYMRLTGGGRYKGPPIDPSKWKSDGSYLTLNLSPSKQIKLPKKSFSKYKFRKHQKCYEKHGLPFDIYHSHYTNWDLVPITPEKVFPNWDTHTSIPDTLARLSSKTLKHLTRHEVVENMPTTPSPHDLAIFNILQKKLAKWEKAEEEYFLRRKGWYCRNKQVEDRAWVSWAMTQNRDFGSAVWRWLRLEDWDEAHTSRMKGLWHQAVYGDWDQYEKLLVGDNSEILQEWKWNQGGLEKETAQKQFIKEAERMGIPRVRWEKFCEGQLCSAEHYGWPVSDIAVNPTMEGCPESRKLFGRSMIRSPPSTSEIERTKAKDTVPISSVLSGLTMVSRLLWTVMQLSWGRPSAEDRYRNGKNRRAWTQTVTTNF